MITPSREEFLRKFTDVLIARLRVLKLLFFNIIFRDFSIKTIDKYFSTFQQFVLLFETYTFNEINITKKNGGKIINC